ncbi:MAG: hypothetical protein IT514_06075 [Burkholderiales bacterium]|nr:hypothetical protein [Burkholderiales bacterium]
MGLFAPRKTPPEVVARLNAAARAVADPAYRQKVLQGVGVSEDEISAVSPERFAAFIREDHDAYREVAAAAGIVPR